MITCPVCGTRNHHLTIVCGSCGGFIQGRVENLDLFSTIWKLIERPRAAFLSISLSRYKNYSTIVPSVAGIGLVFAFFWFIPASFVASAPAPALHCRGSNEKSCTKYPALTR